MKIILNYRIGTTTGELQTFNEGEELTLPVCGTILGLNKSGDLVGQFTVLSVAGPFVPTGRNDQKTYTVTLTRTEA